MGLQEEEQEEDEKVTGYNFILQGLIVFIFCQ